MGKRRADRLSYLLRLWRVHNEGEGTWRVSLRSAQTGECLGFASLEEAFCYLQERMSEGARAVMAQENSSCQARASERGTERGR